MRSDPLVTGAMLMQLPARESFVRRSALLSVVLVAFLPRSGLAQALHLPPLVRIHGGASLVEAPAPLGAQVGMDTRLTRLVLVDLGAFYSPGDPTAWTPPTDPSAADWFRTRHGISVAPGVRIPHQQPKAFTYEIIVRVGMNVLFLADLNPETHVSGSADYAQTALAAASGGADLLLQRGAPGLRLASERTACSIRRCDRPCA